MASNKVCPNCGCDTFEVVEHSHRRIYINGDGEFISSGDDWHLDSRDTQNKCIDCDKTFHDLSELTTEQHFHEEIATEGM